MNDIESIREWEAWKDICSELCIILDISKEEFNKRKDIRKLVTKIANWGYYNTILSEKTGMNKPVFCDVV